MEQCCVRTRVRWEALAVLWTLSADALRVEPSERFGSDASVGAYDATRTAPSGRAGGRRLMCAYAVVVLVRTCARGLTGSMCRSPQPSTADLRR